MKSTRQKGNQFQHWCAAWLEEQGYDVYNQKTVVHHTKSGTWVTLAADIFGCDIVAIKTGEKPLFIQATLHSGVQKRLDELKKYPWPLDYVRVQLWQKRGNVVNIKELDGQQLLDYKKIIKRKLYPIDPTLKEPGL